jgi:hypothetical protein
MSHLSIVWPKAFGAFSVCDFASLARFRPVTQDCADSTKRPILGVGVIAIGQNHNQTGSQYYRHTKQAQDWRSAYSALFAVGEHHLPPVVFFSSAFKEVVFALSAPFALSALFAFGGFCGVTTGAGGAGGFCGVAFAGTTGAGGAGLGVQLRSRVRELPESSLGFSL